MHPELLVVGQEFLNMSTLEISEFVSEIETFLLKENSEELTQGILDRVTSKVNRCAFSP